MANLGVITSREDWEQFKRDIDAKIEETRRIIEQPFIVYRSSITGRFVSAEYAQQHPETTVREQVPWQ